MIHDTQGMGDLNELVARLLARYWDLAYAEGREGRSHDTPAGDAQETLSAIRDALTSLIAERDGLETKVGLAQYAMDTVARFVRPRIPADQNPEQATSFLAWIGMILRLEERAERAETRAETAEAKLKAAREALTEIASGKDKDGNTVDFFQDIAGEALAALSLDTNKGDGV